MDGSPAAAPALEEELEGILQQLRTAVNEEAWEELPELDRRARRLIEQAFGSDPRLADASGARLRAVLEALSAFYSEAVPDLEQRRRATLEEIKALQAGRKGVSAYQAARRSG
ncbi:flagellar protein FliT [Thioalkalivibrio sp. ARh3]|uniref:flagellar protein FliT n=1 Tax=Thioalkalivibrio sp. ARh3 TaxID=1158148 RepID=UPI000376AE25|nr:flagellar protein FliT [Thioalkalivibrio sp. ARh3]